ncbi:hypothetical protein HDU67_001155 [Dinochytrium kinnereticum]|nr:hypothetical protein HDU67_001155 [Dinochytrium kinnereticum]
MSPKLYLYGFLALAVASVGFYIAALVLQGPFLIAPAYWLLFAGIWSILAMIAVVPWLRTVRHAQTPSSKIEDAYVNEDPDTSVGGFIKSSWGSLLAAVIAVIGSLMAFGGSLAARAPEKITAIGCLINMLAAAGFIWVKYQTYISTKGLTTSKTVRNWNAPCFNFLLLPIYGILGFFLVFLTVTSTFQSVGLGSDNARLPPLGELLPVGGEYKHKLHVYCTGQKVRPTDPTVWFEHGLGGQSADFSWVQQDVATYARACSYDHAGLGYSEIGPFPRTTERIVDELDNLLRTNNITGDLLLVGHSMAGFNTRVAQRKLTANKVVGIVLVDPVSYLDYSRCNIGDRWPLAGLYSLGVQINTWGLVRLLSVTPVFPQIKNIRSLPSLFSPRYLANLLVNSNQLTRNSESTNFPTSCGQTKSILNTPRLLPNGTTGVDPLLGDLPFGLVVCGDPRDAVASQTLFNVSVGQVTINATESEHVSILHREEEVKIVYGLTRTVFGKVVGRSV